MKHSTIPVVHSTIPFHHSIPPNVDTPYPLGSLCLAKHFKRPGLL